MAPFKYQPRPEENWDKRAKGSLFEGYAKDEFPTFIPKKENSIRILPPTWPKPGHYGIDLWVHWSVGPNNATVICLSKMGKGACPVCEAFQRAEAQGREDAKELRPTRRVLVWLLDRKEEKQPLLWAMPQTVDRDISKVCRDRGTGELYQIDNPDSGRDVFFDREQKGASTQNVEYTGFQISTRESSVDKKHIDYIVAHPVPDVLHWRSYEDIQALLEGGVVTEVKPHEQTHEVPPPVHTAPPPPPPPPVIDFPPEGWNEHPQAPGYYYKGQEVKSEADLRAMTAPPPPPPSQGGNGRSVVPISTVEKQAPITTESSTAKTATGAAAALRRRFDTGDKK